MHKTSLILATALFATAGSSFAAPGNISEGALTVQATVSSEGEFQESATTRSQALVSQRLGNRQLLELMVQNQYLETIVGYSLVQRFYESGESLGYYAVSATDMVPVPDEILGLTTVSSVESFKLRLRPDRPETGKVKIKTYSTLVLGDNNFSLLDNVTITSSVRSRVAYEGFYNAVQTNGSFAGVLDGDYIIEASLRTSRSRALELVD